MANLISSLNADFAQRVVIDTQKLEWLQSPAKGVQRRPLDRIGLEVARATTIVHYAAGSTFPSHTHTGGEEYLVLDGVFSDEDGDHPAGTYVRNPVGSSHAPHTDGGCTIFVKLHQMPESQTDTVVVDSTVNSGWQHHGDNVQILSLFNDPVSGEIVEMIDLSDDSSLGEEQVKNGEELLVLEGEIEDEFGRYTQGTWIRNPNGLRRSLTSKSGARVWRKHGHLTDQALALFTDRN